MYKEALKDDIDLVKKEIKALGSESFNSSNFKGIQYYAALLKDFEKFEQSLDRVESKINTGIANSIIDEKSNLLKRKNFMTLEASSQLNFSENFVENNKADVSEDINKTSDKTDKNIDKQIESNIDTDHNTSNQINNDFEPDNDDDISVPLILKRNNLKPIDEDILKNCISSNIFVIRLSNKSYAKCRVENTEGYTLLAGSRSLKDLSGKESNTHTPYIVESNIYYSSIEELSESIIGISALNWNNLWVNRDGLNLTHWKKIHLSK